MNVTVHLNVSVLLQCVRQCTAAVACMSAVLDSQSKICLISTGIKDGSIDNIDCGRRLIYVERRVQIASPIPIRGSCKSGDTCRPINSNCRTSICTCYPGYSYNASIDACVTSCSTYGQTYQRDKGKLLDGQSYITLHNIDTFSCGEQCAADPSCRSYFYYLPDDQCYLSTKTALTAPGSYITYDQFDLYQRDCD